MHKASLIALMVAGVSLTSCQMLREVNNSTYAIRQNRLAIERSTEAIEKNIQALEKVTQNVEKLEQG